MILLRVRCMALRLAAPLLVSVLAFAAPAVAQERSAHANYILRCAGCHGLTGTGAPAAGIADFNDAVGAFTRTDDGRTYLMHVPGIAASRLSDEDIAAVLNYVVETWAGTSRPEDYVPFTAEEVTQRRALAIPDVVAFRREVVEALAAMGIDTAPYPWD